MRAVRKSLARLTGMHHVFGGKKEVAETAIEEKFSEEEVIVPPVETRVERHDEPLPEEELGGYTEIIQEVKGALECRDAPGCWRRIEASTFRVRDANYLKTNRKVPSQAALYEIVTIYLFKCPKRINNLIGRGIIPKPATLNHIEGIPSIFVVSCQLPEEVGLGPIRSPPINADGPNHSVVFVARLKADVHETSGPEIDLLRTYFKEAYKEAQEHPQFRGRFKVIAGANDPLTLPALARSYNYKPALITRSGSLYKEEDALELDISIFRFGYASRSGLNHIKPSFASLSLNIAFLIEARAETELPERLLFAAQLCECGLDQAHNLLLADEETTTTT